MAATACIALSLVVFFLFTFPTNRATENWTVLPANWTEFRRRWEYSHAAGATFYFVALALPTAAVLVEHR